MRSKPALVAVLAAALAAATGCGDSEPEPAPAAASPGGDTAITVAVMPIVEAAAVYVAQEQGFFADAGLDVTIEEANTSSAIIPGLVSGQYDIGFSNLVTFLLADAQDLGLTAVAPASAPNPAGGEDMAAVIALDPDITTAADLAGRTVGVNALNNIAAVSLHESVRAAGGDPGAVELVELGFAEQLTALQDGRIDAGFTVEPFLAVAAQSGAHAVSYPYLDVDPEIAISAYVATAESVEADPAVADAFAAAVVRAAELIASDPDVLFDAVGTFSDIDPALYPELILCGFPTSLDPAAIQRWAELMVADGLIETAPDPRGLIRDGA